MTALRLITLVTVFLAVSLGLVSSDCTVGENRENDLLACTYSRDQYGKCEVRGDPHHTTFDEVKYSFDGVCEYRLVEFCDVDTEEELQITADFDERPDSPTSEEWTNLVSVTLRINDQSFTISKAGFDQRPDSFSATAGDVTVYGRKPDPSTQVGDQHPYYLLIVVNEDGEIIAAIWYKPKYHWVQIYLKEDMFSGQVCGMCGLYNGDPDDDLKTKSNKPDSNRGPSGGGSRRRRKRMAGSNSATKLGSKWKISNTC